MSDAIIPITSFRRREGIEGLTSQPPSEIADDCPPAPSGIVGDSRSLRHALQQARIVAPTDSTVVLYGETGTGKELFGRLIHNLSGRRGGPLVSMNCAAIPEGLLESELFGHEKGAFTSAIAQRRGRFEAANRGTLFLDEIGDIPLALQPKLLRILQEQEFERLGSNRTVRVDVRVIAATNKDLSNLVDQGQFRSDLFYRLNVFPIVLPPLRERREDIPSLVNHLVMKAAERMRKPIRRIPADAMETMMDYSWPGNVRELQNFVERAVILAEDGVLRISTLECKTMSPSAQSGASTLCEVQRERILQVLEETNWVIGGSRGAAAVLGLPRTTLLSKMQKLGISRCAPQRFAAQRASQVM
ncbi:MAG: Sigma-54 dependent transcriptional regulator (modular protein) [Bryobacterales bacterium]|nr:Sigma-54 dependent transcriptional regulator (modular protein) [Bryobacterales bacterium]